MSSATAFQPPATAKRNRTSSQSSGSSVSSREYVASKATRISPPAELDEGSSPTTNSTTGHPLLCTLPPTCSHKPTPLYSTRELESHYATYHAHVCEQPGCGCVFPDARLLELHQTENHDPIAAMRKDRGEKIFACHLASCPRAFSNPKNRRLHLISAHTYPKEYFFAVTNKGVGGLLKKWGEGASMVRGKWKPRESSEEKDGNPQIKVDKETMRSSSSGMDVDDDEDDSDEDDMRGSDDDDDAPPPASSEARPPQATRQSFYNTLPKPDNVRMSIDQDPEATPRPYASARSLPPDPTDSLVSGISTLSLIPPSVRFGRGRGGGFATASGRPAHQPKQASASQTPAGDGIDEGVTTKPTAGAGTDTPGESASIGVGIGYRGRGRGGRGYKPGEASSGGRGGRGRGRGRGRGG